MQTYRVSNDLFLTVQPVSTTKPKAVVRTNVNHIAVLDCSGSMSYDLPKIREQLKKKLPKLLSDGDTFSAIWFSGKGEFGTLLEAEPVNTLADLKDVNQAIDRWLKPIGLTGFKEPIQEVGKLAESLLNKRPGSVCSLIFMSDGHDNQWSRTDIMKALEGSASKLAGATFVAYGYYADNPLLTKMAETSGGSVILAEDFDRYQVTFEKSLQKQLTGAKKVAVPIEGDVVGGFAYAFDGQDLLTFGLDNGSVLVPEDTKEIYYLTTNGTAKRELVGIAGMLGANYAGKIHGDEERVLSAAYAAISLFSVRMNPDVVYPLLKAVGDVRFINQFSGCFGKQKYTDFTDVAKEAAFGRGRFQEGFNPDLVPREDAFTVLDLLRVLSEDEGNRVLLDHPSFKYSRVSRGRVDSSEVLTVDEQQQIQEITQEMASEKDVKKIKLLQEKLASITASKQEALKFEADDVPDGYSISSLTYNEERPNVSMLVKKYGTVDLKSRISGMPEEEDSKAYQSVPVNFRTFVYRNYTIIRDGLVNVETLPVKLTDTTRATLSKAVKDGRLDVNVLGIRMGLTGEGPNALIDLRKLPVINRKMVKEVSAQDLFEKEYELAKARAAQKVYNTYKKEMFPRKSEGWELFYGPKTAAWLKDQGLTDYGGFAPKAVQAESTDVYMGKELKVSLKGLSSLPKVADVKAKMAGKLTPSAALMAPTVKEVETFLNSGMVKNASDQNYVVEQWLDKQTKAATEKARRYIYELAQIKFSVVVGQIWFKEFASLDEGSLKITVDGNSIDCKVEMREVSIKI